MREKLQRFETPRSNVELVKLLGEGHFGQVWQANVWKLASAEAKGSSTVAVKLLKGQQQNKYMTELTNLK